MSPALYLSRARVRIRRGEPLSAIAPVLLPSDPRQQAGLAHRLVWLLFQDIPDSTRDFLWRDDGDGRFLVLSRRPPSDPNGIFELDTKEFSPSLAAGDRLRFSLRANPVMATKRGHPSKPTEGRVRGKRVDVVMDALHAIPPARRAQERDRIAVEAGTRWLTSQGLHAGFKPGEGLSVSGYTQIPIEDQARRRREGAGISVLEFAGEIEITDPPAFIAKLGMGFGSAKAFGNGLMLIRRA